MQRTLERASHVRRASIALYALAVFLFWGAQYIFLPTLPTYVQIKTNNLAAVGLVLSMYGLWQAVVRIPLGIAVDWLGWRKPFIVAGLALAGVGAWIMAIAGGAGGLAIGRAITGASAGTWVVLVVAFSALFPPQDAVRASSLLMVANSLGRIFATAITGSLNDLGGYTLPFFIAIGIAILSALIVLPIDEPRREPQRPSMRGIGRLLARQDVLLPTLLSAVGQYALWTSSFGFVPVLAKQFGATNIQQSAIVTLHIAAATCGSLIASAHAQRIGAPRMIYASFASLASGIACAALAPSLPMLFAAPALVGMGMGLGYPVLMGMSIERVDDSERTIAMGLHQSIYAIGMFAGPAFSGMIAEALGLPAMFGITAAGCLALGWMGTRGLGEEPRKN